MQILHWSIPHDLKQETETHYRSRFALELKDRGPLEIIRQITFDGVAPRIEVIDIKNLLRHVTKTFLPGLSGNGLEVGAGPGTFSSVLASFPEVDKVYALEVCAPIVELLAPKIARSVLGDQEHKVVGVVGDFNHIELPDQSLDFIFDFFSLHHSSDLHVTLTECARVLKPGGFIFCLDKARPDYYSEEDLGQLLDAEYSDTDKQALFGVSAGQKFTRRDNGEKEYRLKDWRASFKQAGFAKVDYYYLDKISSGRGISKIIKSAISLFPAKLQVAVNVMLPVPTQHHKFILSSRNRIYSRFVNPFRKEMSLLIAYK